MSANQKNPIGQLRWMATVEGFSFLALLFIAMPLKYVAGIPEVVSVIGWIHGVLFVYFCFLLERAWSFAGWSIRIPIESFISSLIPFGTFWYDKKLKMEENRLLEAMSPISAMPVDAGEE
jgi:integral membrane protein